MGFLLPLDEKKILAIFVSFLFLIEVTETIAEVKGYFQYTKLSNAGKCLKDDLISVENGYFNCSGHSVGGTCILTCDQGYFASSSRETTCKELDFVSIWTLGTFVCSEIKCFEQKLPVVMNGIFSCPDNTDLLKGDVCNLTCRNPFYPSQSKQAICEAGNGDFGGEWIDGNFKCDTIECKEWNDWSGHTYKWIETHVIWDEASSLCQEIHGGHLVNIENQEENDFVRKMLSYCLPSVELYAWIGLGDLEKNDKWEWSNHENSSYRNWDTRYPAQPEHRETEDYVGMEKDLGKWHDFTYQSYLPAICEKNNRIELPFA